MGACWGATAATAEVGRWKGPSTGPPFPSVDRLLLSHKPLAYRAQVRTREVLRYEVNLVKYTRSCTRCTDWYYASYTGYLELYCIVRVQLYLAHSNRFSEFDMMITLDIPYKAVSI